MRRTAGEIFGQQRERGAHVAANGGAGHGEPCIVKLLLHAVGGSPAGHRIGFLKRRGVFGLGREAIVGKDDGGSS